MAKEKKSFSLLQIGAFALSLCIGGYVGFLLGGPLNQLSEQLQAPSSLAKILIIFAFAFVGMGVGLVFHEGGHLVCGLLSGYKFLSFRVGKFMLLKEADGFHWKQFHLPGTGGQCLLLPPDCDPDQIPTFLYNLGGGLCNIFLFLGACAGYALWKNPWAQLFFMVLGAMNLLFALTNLCPLKMGGVANDGHNLLSLGKDPLGKRVFYLQLKINGLQHQGVRLRDMPAEWFVLPPEANRKSGLIAAIDYYAVCRIHDAGDYKAAKTATEALVQNPHVLELYKNEARCELLFYELLGECRKDEVERLYSKALKKYIQATAAFPARQRLLYCYALRFLGDSTKAEIHRKRLEKTIRTYPNPSEIACEMEIMEKLDALWPK